jgi:hypothetical protein
MSSPVDEARLKALAEVQAARTKAHYAVHFANRALVQRGWADPVYVATRRALDAVMVELAAAKTLFGRIDGTWAQFVPPAEDADALRRAQDGFLRVIRAAEQARDACQAGRAPEFRRPELTPHHEIKFSGAAPLVPTISPIVVLKGSNRDMGRQYAQQVIEIYGPWIFARQAARAFSEGERAELRRWEAELGRCMPEILDFARGWAEGASAAGLAMSYDQALAIWTGVRPPAREPRPMAFATTDEHDDRVTAAYLGVAAGAPREAVEDMCSGMCAWGQGTADGELIAGATTDHDCTFQATIVAYPDEGHAFIYTPFSANGSIPALGDFFMAGHPGMNDRGLAYVHHGGANTGEPESEWGYGVRRGPATFHILQFAGDARAARDMQLRWPVGDSGISLGTPGGLFADRGYGFSLEARAGAPAKPQPIVREHSHDAFGKAFDFLYANNNAIAPESGQLNVPPPGGYRYSLAGGWFTFDPRQIGAEPGAKMFRRLNTKNSECRNRYAYRTMMLGYGGIDLDYMTMAYRQGGTIPPGGHDEVCARWNAGEQWDCSTAHRANAFTAVLSPRAGDDGVYRGCVGPANRAVNCRDPGHGYYYHDETNAFWELRLRPTPEAMVDEARSRACAELGEARRRRSALPGGDAGAEMFDGWLDEADRAVEAGAAFLHEARDARGDARWAAQARALRAFTRAQVRAAQVRDAIDPPPSTPAELRR